MSRAPAEGSRSCTKVSSAELYDSWMEDAEIHGCRTNWVLGSVRLGLLTEAFPGTPMPLPPQTLSFAKPASCATEWFLSAVDDHLRETGAKMVPLGDTIATFVSMIVSAGDSHTGRDVIRLAASIGILGEDVMSAREMQRWDMEYPASTSMLPVDEYDRLVAAVIRGGQETLGT